MKIKLLRGCVANGKARKTGTELVVNTTDGKYLVALGAAEEVKVAEKKEAKQG